MLNIRTIQTNMIKKIKILRQEFKRDSEDIALVNQSEL